jgi:hypothetical protein
MKKIHIFVLINILIVFTGQTQIINLNDNSIPFKTKSIAATPQELLKEAKAVRVFSINPALQSTKNIKIGDIVSLQLFENQNYTAEIFDITTDINENVTLTLKLPDYPMGFAIITTSSERKLLVNVSIPELGLNFGSRYNGNVNNLIEIDQSKVEFPHFEDDAIEISEEAEMDGNAQNSIASIVQAASCGPVYNTNVDVTATIDLLVVYTPAAASSSYTSSHGGINNVIASMIALGNTCFTNSQTGITLRLAHSTQINYTETGDMHVSIDRLKGTSDGYMDNVHTLRKQHNADLVQLLSIDDNSGGLGYLPTTRNGDLSRGFSVCGVRSVGDNYPASVHELGHNMGLGHGANMIKTTYTGIFTYSQGWDWTGNNSIKYCSVMGYWTGDAYSDGQNRTNTLYFSNPDVTYQGVATGNVTRADAARHLREMKHVVAYYSDKLNNTLDAPTNIRVTNPTNYGATFSWSAVPCAAKYHVYFPNKGY